MTHKNGSVYKGCGTGGHRIDEPCPKDSAQKAESAHEACREIARGQYALGARLWKEKVEALDEEANRYRAALEDGAALEWSNPTWAQAFAHFRACRETLSQNGSSTTEEE